MKTLILLLSLATTVAVHAQVLNSSYTLASGERVLRHETVVDAPVAKVWRAFTTPEEMRGFIAPVIALDLEPGGIWEAAYDPSRKIGQPGNIKNEVMSFVPEKMLSIRIHSTPPNFPHADIGKSVWTVIWFEDVGGGKTRITTEMLPWKSGPNWDMVYAIFASGNEITLKRAKQYFEKGPIDWSK